MREITVAEAAARFHYSVSHIRSLCASGQVKAKRFGKSWVVNTASLAHYASQRHPPGRVPKERRA